jgi:hypothetical protein
MASDVLICNKALSRIGCGRISSLVSPSTKEAKECKLIFETCRDATLEAHDWSFARKRKELSKYADSYAGWDYAYQIPPDCIAPRKIYDPYEGEVNIPGFSSTREPIKFEPATNSDLDKGLILTNQDDALLIYTARVTDVNRFSAMYIDALAYKLAADLAVPLRGKEALSRTMIMLFDAAVVRAQASDAQKGYETPNTSNSFVESRY